MSLPPALVAEVGPKLKSRAALADEVQRLGEIVVRLTNRAVAVENYLSTVDGVPARVRDDLRALLVGGMS